VDILHVYGGTVETLDDGPLGLKRIVKEGVIEIVALLMELYCVQIYVINCNSKNDGARSSSNPKEHMKEKCHGKVFL
jgi:hypothetical protein